MKREANGFLKTVLSAVLFLSLSTVVRAEEDRVEKLIKHLKSRDRYIRSAAAEALGQEIDDSRVVGPLVNTALKDAYSEARKKAAESLVKIKHPSVADHLLTFLEDDRPNTRSQAILILGKREEKSALEPLIKILKDRDDIWYVRKKAAEALGNIGDDHATNPLIKVLSDPDARIREVVVEALGKLKDRRAIKPLILRLKDDDPKVRGKTARVMRKNKMREAVGPLIDAMEKEKNPRVYTSILLALKGITEAVGVGRDHRNWREWWKKHRSGFR